LHNAVNRNILITFVKSKQNGLSKLVIIKILLAVTICFQQLAPCLSLFVSAKDFGHKSTLHRVNYVTPVKKGKHISFHSPIHLQIWSILSKHHGHLPVSPRLKAIFWTSLAVGVLFVAFLNVALFVSRKRHQQAGLTHIYKRPIYLLLGQLTV